jgi:hypothetical protein
MSDTLSTPTAAPSPLAPLAMTLAGLAYAFPEDIERYLANGASTRGWAPTWVPEEREGYFAYVAAAPAANGWAVAVRGTNPSATFAFIQNVRSDVDVWKAIEWKHAAGKGARIADGASRGLDVISSLKDDGGETLVEHLVRTVPSGATVLVTGHSLGGCLASVLALYLQHEARGHLNVRPITFAAPTAGDQRFAELYEQAFPHAERYFNRMDLVPRAWHDIAQFKDLYDDPGPRCPPDFGLLASRIAGAVSKHGYTQPGAGVALPAEGHGPPRPAPGGLAAMVDRFLRRHVFFVEALHQHMPDTYLANLGTDPLPFKFPLRWARRNFKRRLSRLFGRK